MTQCLELGSHHMFLAEVVAVHVSEAYMDGKGKFHLEQAQPMAYSHGAYFDLRGNLGTFALVCIWQSSAAHGAKF